MDRASEEAELGRVTDRVAERFPTVDPADVEAVVEDEVQQLDDARVRDYIPVLVEHQAVERLRGVAEPVPLADRLSAKAGDAGEAPVDDAQPSDDLGDRGDDGPTAGPLLGGLRGGG